MCKLKLKHILWILYFSCRWRIEERSFLSENAINDAEDESRPLLAHDPLAYNERPMSPAGQPMGGEGRQPVVGYISNSNARQNYGSTVPVSVGTTSVMRSLESPALYNAQVFLSCWVFRWAMSNLLNVDFAAEILWFFNKRFYHRLFQQFIIFRLPYNYQKRRNGEKLILFICLVFYV